MNNFVLVGLILGALIGGPDRWHLGIVGGVILGFALAKAKASTDALSAQLALLSAKVEELQKREQVQHARLSVLDEEAMTQTSSDDLLAADSKRVDMSPGEPEHSEPAPLEPTPWGPGALPSPLQPEPSAATSVDPTAAPTPSSAQRKDAEKSVGPEPYPDWSERALAGLKELIFGGNTVVRAGIFVLLVGVTLQLKYAAENSQLPLELRLAAAGVIGLALTLLGLRLRKKQKIFSETLQGGGVATMFLVVFFSYRVYELLPAPLAFVLFVGIAALSGILAVVQNAMSLILIGQVGGFLAPILASSGEGNHVALFGYYLVLNLSVTAIAWFRAWRPLNLVGFVFTFGIGTIWGALSYRAEHFTTTEPFLLAFFLLYVAIPVLFALRGPFKGWVDGSLVFGAPLAFLGLQLVLVREIPFAMAVTTLLMAGLYLALVRLLQKKAFVAFDAMRSSYLALAIGFLTLAIPYGLNNSQLSSATWAVEGAGLYFLGIKQHRRFSRFAALLLQLLAGAALFFYASNHTSTDALPFLHGRVTASAFLLLSCLFIAEHAYQNRAQLPRYEVLMLQGLIAWGLLHLVSCFHTESKRVFSRDWLPCFHIAFFGFLGICLEILGARRKWPWVRYAPASSALLLLPLTLYWLAADVGHLLGYGGVVVWPLYFTSLYLTLKNFVPTARARWGFLHVVVLWSFSLWLGLAAYGLLSGPLNLNSPWTDATFGMALVAILWLLGKGQNSNKWPINGERTTYLGLGRQGLLLMVLTVVLTMNLTSSGKDNVLGYLPLVNPGELFQATAFWVALSWWRNERKPPGYSSKEFTDALFKVIVALIFLSWNGLLARTMHRFADVSWSPDALWNYGPLQVAFALSWAVIGLAVTALSSRAKQRKGWNLGAALLGVVVVKLFVLDLANLAATQKIGTFLAVGVLLLLVGYYSPVPPAKEAPSQPSPISPDSPRRPDQTEPQADRKASP